jgi:hypothetical protein
MNDRLYSIGAFGFTESGFFDALTGVGIDLFCDIRRRRGVRGMEFAFVNSTRLQKRLADLGIRYVHALELAPPEPIRAIQNEADRTSRTAKRSRTKLSEAFAADYTEACLSEFDSQAFINRLGGGSSAIAFFCVEQEPTACHRSIVVDRLSRDLGIEVTHLRP